MKPIAIVDLMHRDTTPAQARSAALFVGVFVIVTFAAAQWSDVRGPVIAPVIPIFASLWGCADLLTAYLLFSQFQSNGVRAFAILGAAYLVPGLLTLPYIAYYPGLFDKLPMSAFFDGVSVSLWCWIVWHLAFAAIIVIYQLIDRRLDVRVADDRTMRSFMRAAIGCAVMLCACTTALIVTFRSALPILTIHGQFTWLYVAVVAPLIVIIDLGTIAVMLVSSRRRSTLQTWLMVTLAVSALEASMNALTNGRFTVSWYAGKVETLSAALIVLMVLLGEVNVLSRRLAALATTDGLTGLSNRQAFDADAHWALEIQNRVSLNLALLVIDVDYFKQYNDTYGHQAGDVCLRRIAESLRRVCGRATDLVARYGGEEFVVLLVGANAGQAARIAEAARADVEALGIEHRASAVAPVVTISVGGIHCHRESAELAELFLRADQALYRAKTRRNAVKIDVIPDVVAPVA
jgi:diguanylate cyclase (GGDEF)-like protein